MLRALVLLLALAVSGPAQAASSVATLDLFLANNRAALVADAEAGGALSLVALDSGGLALPAVLDLGAIAEGESLPCFIPLPDGSYLVATAAGLGRYGASGLIGEFIPVFGVTGLALGPNGTLVATTEDEILVLDLETGTEINAIEMADVINPCFLPDGSLLVGDSTNNTLYRIDPATGTVLQTVEIDPGVPLFSPQVTGIARSHTGTLAVTVLWDTTDGTNFPPEQTTQLALLKPSLIQQDLPTPLFIAEDIVNPCFLPNERLEVLDRANGAVAEIDLAALQVVSVVPLPAGVQALAVIPHRFEVELSGDLVQGGGTVKNLKETALFTLTPGSGVQALAFDPLGAVYDQVAPGARTVGLEARETLAAGARLLQGGQIGASGLTGLGVSADSALAANDFVALDGLTGQLQITRGGAMLLAEVKSKTLLNDPRKPSAAVAALP